MTLPVTGLEIDMLIALACMQKIKKLLSNSFITEFNFIILCDIFLVEACRPGSQYFSVCKTFHLVDDSLE